MSWGGGGDREMRKFGKIDYPILLIVAYFLFPVPLDEILDFRF